MLTQARPTAASGAAAAGRSRRLLQRGYNPLVWAVARVPARVRTKLLVAFLAIAALLVVVALLGLRVLGQSNSRAARLGALQVRVGGYRQLEADAAALRQLLALCASTPGYDEVSTAASRRTRRA